jgi:nitrogen fixation/metabolism regulation signal transduction histidine kinase
MQAEPLVLDRLISDVIDLYRSAHPGEGIEVDLQCGDAEIKGDSLRLRQVVHNLVKNAQEALDGRDDGLIRLSTGLVGSSESPQLELAVEDNGGGIDPELLGHLFEPYVTTKTKGTGLGLAIVKKIIEEHGGMIWAENRNGGARLAARLPVWRKATGIAAASRPTAPARRRPPAPEPSEGTA